MSPSEIRVDRVLGDGPFREIGEPRVTAVSPDGRLIVVGGALAHPQWHGRDVSARSRPHPGWYPLAVYRADDLTCRHHGTTRWRANAIAFHPTLPLVAIGTGSYDGGWAYEGELLLLDLTTGSVVSLLAYPREVRRIRWHDPHRLDLVLAIPCDEDEKRFGGRSLACSISRDDWATVGDGMLRPPYGEEPVPDPPSADLAAAAAHLDRLAGERGLAWARRRTVWAVRGLADGRILAALEAVGLECWSGGSVEQLWRLPAEGTGCQIMVAPDERAALALTQTPPRFQNRGWITDPSVLRRVDLAAGEVRATETAATPVVVTSRTDGWWALRDSRHDSRAARGKVLLRAPAGESAAVLRLGRYDLFNQFLDIRYAPELLFLQGREDKPWRDKWVVAVDPPDGRVRRLFPLEWDASRGGHLYGGAGAYVEDSSGPALVHTGVVHDGAGLLPGNAFVVRRAYPGGAAQWAFTADHQATALDVDHDLVYVAFNSGELVVLDAHDGTVRLRQELRLGGHCVVPLSLTRLAPGRLAIGTLDGRILDCTVVT
ncbi:hypothetical protein [Micromonospora sp. NPDC004551]|uniref:hypothetical protein n=1 Tax=Micromonospora sp. NPDC004551 TaxID=3154284 RepID=UPI0033ACD2C8